MAGIAILFVYLIVMVALLAIPIAIGVYVYRDAKRRGMNAILWAMVAVFAPSLIGFIIYLIVRENYSDLECPQCNTKVKEQYVVCPSCGAKLQPYCDTCGTVVSPEWKLCPTCTQPLSGDYSDVVIPKKTKDRTLGKILVLVILIPIILVVVITVSFFLYGGVKMSGSSSDYIENLKSVKYNEFFEGSSNLKVSVWLDGAKKSNKAQVLKYTETNEYEYTHYYLLYIPGAGKCVNYGHATYGNTDGWSFIAYLTGEDSKDEYVYCFAEVIEYTIVDDFEVVYNGQRYECEVTEVNYNPIEEYYDVEMLIEQEIIEKKME